jgi:hypothetical protein
MALPLYLPITIIGSLLAHQMQSFYRKKTHLFVIAPLALLPILSGFERTILNEPPLFDVTTRIIIEAPPCVVWENLVGFNQLDPPEELIFKAGVSYPVKAEIEGAGVGAIRYCVFNAGSFIEPIQVWDEPRLLQFSVVGQPPPMTELTPYKNIHPPHLDGYFTSKKGQFLLTELPNGFTELEGTTWYTQDIWPLNYWKIWSDFILHKIHWRVLNHIKKNAEASYQAETKQQVIEKDS